MGRRRWHRRHPPLTSRLRSPRRPHPHQLARSLHQSPPLSFPPQRPPRRPQSPARRSPGPIIPRHHNTHTSSRLPGPRRRRPTRIPRLSRLLAQPLAPLPQLAPVLPHGRSHRPRPRPGPRHPLGHVPLALRLITRSPHITLSQPRQRKTQRLLHSIPHRLHIVRQRPPRRILQPVPRISCPWMPPHRRNRQHPPRRQLQRPLP